METLVIGGGLIGLTSAYVLQTMGESVTLLEAKKGIGLDTSFANGGLLTASMSDPWNAPGACKQLVTSLVDPNSAMKLRMAALPSLFFWGLHFLRHSSVRRHSIATAANYALSTYSIKKTKALREQLDLTYQSCSTGTLKLFRNKAAMVSSLAIAKRLQGVGLLFKQLSANEVIELEPALEPIEKEIAGALYFPNDESGDAYLFCQALAQAFKQAGGTIQTQTTAHRIAIEKQKVIGVETGQGFLPAKRVVLAAGNQSPSLLKGTGLSLRIKPVKGYSLTVDLNGSAVRPIIPVIDDALHAAATPLGTRLRLAGTAEFAGFDARLDSRRIDNLLNFLKALYPNIYENMNRETASPWTGFRPMSADGLPFIGPSNIKGLYINTGHGHLGWTMAMGSAHLLASFIREQTPDIDPSPFNPLR
ncbi:FAD-dependent oxidoreductase [Porticoccaceae bacterium]|nr:FAD-dependent oxidoreductase [Porticoccaceae bacterium]